MKTFLSAYCAFIGILIMLQAASCKKENTQAQYAIPGNLKMVSSGYAAGAAARVEIYAANSLFVGYNQLYIALYDSATNARITQGQVTLAAAVNTAGLTRYCPVENPTLLTANNGLFNAAVIFTQASANWNLSIQLQSLTGSKSGNYNTVVNVVQLSPALAYQVTSPDDSTHVFVSLVQPINPQLGVNTFELAIYKQTNGTAFTPYGGYNVLINPIMPSMSGMNSPNNVNPVYTSNGHYTGKVDFIMDGAWQVNVSLLLNGTVADSTHYFALNL